MNKPKRDHHVTPKLYLKGFVITPKKPFIWVYKRGETYNPGNGKVTNNPFKDSVKIVGVERDFYANPGLPGADRFEAFENDLEKLEKRANTILPKLAAGQTISAAERAVFAAYVIHFHRRGEAGREMLNSMLPSTIMNYEPPDEAYKKFGLPKTVESKLILQAVALNIALKPGYPVHMHQGIVNASAVSFMAKALNQMTWHLLNAPAGHAFVTCDNPVFFDRATGLGSSLSELTFPICSQYTLLASWWKLSNDFVLDVSLEVLEEVNHRTIHNAVKHVYANDSLASIAAAFGSLNYHCRPISPATVNFKVVDFIVTTPREAHMKQLVALPLTRDTCPKIDN